MSHTKLTILCDLDDTLLKNDFNAFLPAYLKAFSNTVTLLPEKVFVSKLLSGTNKMISNQCPTQTLQEVFDVAFFSAIELDKSTLEPVINHFYSEIFQTLQPLTASFAESKKIVEYALENHLHTVIATNPLFPFTATAQRLEWARISTTVYPFSLVTTYETFHFSKPSVSYYAEILGQLGWPDNLAVMIGNDLEEDIRPASILGLPTYWVTRNLETSGFDRHPLSGQGSLDGVIPWLDKISKEIDAPMPLALNSLPDVLKSNPAVIDTLLNRNYTNGHAFRTHEVSQFVNELIQHESMHLEDLMYFPVKSGTNIPNKDNLPALNQEAVGLPYFFHQRGILLAEITKNLQMFPSSSDKQAFLTFLKTISQTDQTMIRYIKTILAG